MYNSPKDIKGYLKFEEHLINVPKDILELCKIMHNLKECISLLSLILCNRLLHKDYKGESN
jgi:hypothetical protein